jgi:hypothetical protein
LTLNPFFIAKNLSACEEFETLKGKDFDRAITYGIDNNNKQE